MSEQWPIMWERTRCCVALDDGPSCATYHGTIVTAYADGSLGVAVTEQGGPRGSIDFDLVFPRGEWKGLRMFESADCDECAPQEDAETPDDPIPDEVRAETVYGMMGLGELGWTGLRRKLAISSIVAALETVRKDERHACAKIAHDHECGAIECEGMGTRIAEAIEARRP